MSPHVCLLVGWLVGRKMNVGLTYIHIHSCGRPDSLLQTYTDGLTDKQIDL